MGRGAGVFASWRRFAWQSALPVVAACAIAAVAKPGEATGIVNPHDTARPKYCLNCHTEEIYTKNCTEGENYCLLGGAVDGICLTCHIKEECCKPGQAHLPKLYLGMKSHPTDVEVSQIPRAYLPRTLPIHHGRITCRTCHLHSRDSRGGYKMLRIVEITGERVDWSGLCRDCHKDR